MDQNASEIKIYYLLLLLLLGHSVLQHLLELSIGPKYLWQTVCKLIQANLVFLAFQLSLPKNVEANYLFQLSNC